MLANELLFLQEKGVSGKILTSSYQLFNDPKIFEKLISYPNLEVRVYSLEDHHTKGYIFGMDDYKSVIIGSSNLTQSALAKNREWNLRIDSISDQETVNNVMSEFMEMWHKATVVTPEWINEYNIIYQKGHQALKQIGFYSQRKPEIIVPNKMQEKALRNLKKLREANINKALLISATGTGKTYLAAFDVKKVEPSRVLFLIHREQIAKAAQNVFQMIIPDKRSALLTGTSKPSHEEIIFATIQSMSLDKNLYTFTRDYFDYIIYDEAHHSGAKTYQKVMDYFKPEFTLGMTATPERTDDFDIFASFEHNIAYEIRLKEALEEDMLVPFHYFGVTDVSIDGIEITDQTDISQLISKKRVELIVEKAKYYGYSGEKLIGLIFCSRVDEAKELARSLQDYGINALALDGTNPQYEREVAIDRLVDPAGDLDYIISVDIFNEGIDIPEINQVIMLRPTQSAIIFTQQLGRGLRKFSQKSYLVVIDFIANYKNNFLIPIALSGDRSFSENNLRKVVMEGSSLLPGASTINFDKISRERIYESLSKKTFTQLQYLKKEYDYLRKRLGKIPRLVDYLIYESLEPQVFLINRSFDNYYKFLSKVEKDFINPLSEIENNILSFISAEFSSGKRLIELEIIEKLIESEFALKSQFSEYEDKAINSALRYLRQDFLTTAESKKYAIPTLIIEKGDVIYRSEFFTDYLLKDKLILAIKDLIEYSKYRNQLYFKNIDSVGLVVGQQYTRKDSSWLLNWKSNQAGQIFGYRIDHETKTIPLFVTYNKDISVSESILYEDYFLDPDTFAWMSKNNRYLISPDIKAIIQANEKEYKILLFIKRNDGEAKQFYYIGEVFVASYHESSISVSKKTLPIVKFEFKLANTIDDNLYYYFVEE